jgi:signal transduction histidine kinase/ActR/RegA family two-component response regulator
MISSSLEMSRYPRSGKIAKSFQARKVSVREPLEGEVRHSGITTIGDVPWGTHFCQFYQDKQELIDTLVPYFTSGLENNEFCIWVTSEPLRAAEARAALAANVENLEIYIANGQLEILDTEWYTSGGKFESDVVLQSWVDRLEEAKRQGFDGLRLTGNTFWLEKPQWHGFMEYEAAVDAIFEPHQILANCTYSLSTCSALQIMDVINNHAFALVKRAGKWEVIQSAERKKVEASLRESEARYRALVTATSDVVYRMGPDWTEMRYLRGKDFMPDTEGPSSAWLQKYIHPEDQPQVMAAINRAVGTKSVFELEHRVLRKDGTVAWTFSRAVPMLNSIGEIVEWFGTAKDITAAKLIQEELLARQKLESIGTLAGGIAHDFNNLLGGVLAQAELALAEHHAGMSVEQELNTIREVAIRGSEIVRQLMIYAGKESNVSGLVNVSRVVEEMLGLLRVSVSKHAALDTTLRQDLPAVRGSAAQLRQIVMNLVINASEAIGDRDGVIRLTTNRVTAKQDAAIIKGLVGGDYLQIEVSDTGAGMSAETRARLFDPFFTTKSDGRGLGLAVVDGIVRGLRGTIHVVSEPGKGTTFKVLLPAVETTPGATSEPTVGAVQSEGVSQAFTVLVVEDEDPLREALVRMLRHAGFEVLEAANGTIATDLLRLKGGQIDLILLDMTIPGASSHEVAAVAAQVRPDLKVVLTSAYGEEMARTTTSAMQTCSFIRKPFQLGVLVQTLQNVLRPGATCEVMRRDEI